MTTNCGVIVTRNIIDYLKFDLFMRGKCPCLRGFVNDSSRKWLMLCLSMTRLKEEVCRYFACVKQLVLRNGTLSWHKATVCWSKWPSLLNTCTKIVTFITIHKSLKPRFSALDLSIPFRWVDWSFLYRNNCNLRNSHIIFLLKLNFKLYIKNTGTGCMVWN